MANELLRKGSTLSRHETSARLLRHSAFDPAEDPDEPNPPDDGPSMDDYPDNPADNSLPGWWNMGFTLLESEAASAASDTYVRDIAPGYNPYYRQGFFLQAGGETAGHSRFWLYGNNPSPNFTNMTASYPMGFQTTSPAIYRLTTIAGNSDITSWLAGKTAEYVRFVHWNNSYVSVTSGYTPNPMTCRGCFGDAVFGIPMDFRGAYQNGGNEYLAYRTDFAGVIAYVIEQYQASPLVSIASLDIRMFFELDVRNIDMPTSGSTTYNYNSQAYELENGGHFWARCGTNSSSWKVLLT